jgi:hypothetical protein
MDGRCVWGYDGDVSGARERKVERSWGSSGVRRRKVDGRLSPLMPVKGGELLTGEDMMVLDKKVCMCFVVV